MTPVPAPGCRQDPHRAGGAAWGEWIRELCRREGIAPNLYYSRSKEFLEAGKKRLLGDTQRQASSREVGELRTEWDQLKHLVAELSLKNRVLHTCPGGRCQGKDLRGQE